MYYKINIKERIKFIVPDWMRPVFEFKKGLVWLAGGALRSYLAQESIQDYDFFFKNKDYAEHILDYFVSIGFYVAFACKKKELFTLKHKNLSIQLVLNQEYRDMESILDSFDFTITQFATDGKFLLFPRDAIRHLRKKERKNSILLTYLFLHQLSTE